MTNLFYSLIPSPLAVTLALLVFTIPVVFAFPSFSTEHSWAPAPMAIVFSPLVIIALSLLAILASYILLCIYQYLKPRLLSTAGDELPQPVSAGRTSSFSISSPLSFLRARSKHTKYRPTWSRWSPFPALLRRLTRPSSPLHLSETELLPTTSSTSASAKTHSLIDLPLMSGGSSVPVTRSQQFKPPRLLSRSSSMDTLPSYRPLTPVPVLVPVPVHTVPPVPSTPPPPSPTPISGVDSSEIPLVPFTPPRAKYTPSTMTNPGGLPTPPLTGTFPAMPQSPIKQNNAAATSFSVVSPRPSSPSPSLFLSSHNIPSLSLSPRSLQQQQQRRSKSLGGVTVKKISPPRFDLAGAEPEQTHDVTDAKVESKSEFEAHTLIVPALEKKEKELKTQGRPTLAPPKDSKFLLNFSSSSSSSSGSGLSSESPSSSPLTSNYGSAPLSAPLSTTRTFSSSSYSSDIAKPSEHAFLLPQPLPLVDVDGHADTFMKQGAGGDIEKVSGWSFDVDEPMDAGVVVEHALVNMSLPVPPPACTKAPLVDLDFSVEGKAERGLIDFENTDTRTIFEQAEGKWGWDDDDLGAGDGHWDLEAQVEKVSVSQTNVWNEPNFGAGFELSALPSPKATLPDAEMSLEMNEGTQMMHPDLGVLPLPDISDFLPSFSNPADLPTISISTQDVLCRKDSVPESETVSITSKERSPLQAQTPTPPASPPPEARMSPLPRIGNGREFGSHRSSPGVSVVPSPVTERLEVPIVVITSATDKEVPTPREEDQPDVEGSLEVQQSSEEHEKGVVTVLDEELVHSPTSISDTSSDLGVPPITVLTSDAGDAVDEGDAFDANGLGVEFEIVPASPAVKIPAWDYGYDTEEEEEVQQQEFLGRERGDAEAFVDDEFDSELEPPSETLLRSTEPAAEPVSVPGHDLPPRTPSPAQVSVSDLKPGTTLPGTFPDALSTAKSQVAESSQPSRELRQHRRTTLEEAIASARSPLEVALAMQLRPGLGGGADPAWMVRFLMVMWGYVFGVALAPSV